MPQVITEPAAEFEMLPYQKLSTTVKRAYEDIMRKGNVPLREWYDKVKVKLGPKRPGRARFRAHLLQRADGKAKAIRIRGISIPKSDIHKIMDVKAIEGDVLIGYSKMALKITRKWDKNRRDNTVSIGDLYDEAVLALMHAICYYTRKDVKFSTFSNWIIKRRLRAKCNRITPLSELPNNAVDLRQKYEETRKTLNGPTTFHQIVDTMRLTDKEGNPRPLTNGECRILKGSLICVFSQTALRGLHGDDGHDERISDYTSLGSLEFNGLSGKRDWRVVAMRGKSTLRPVFAPHEESVFDLEEQIKAVDFSPFEQQVLEGFLRDGTSGWMTKVAAENINPETGRPYSKMSVTYAWKRIINKLREQCGEEE